MTADVLFEQEGSQYGTLNSREDFGLVFTTKTIGTPSVVTKIVDIVGRGPVDLSEVVTGGITYGNREITIGFEYIGTAAEWQAEMHLINNAIHGKRLKVTFCDDEEYYYIGRCSVEYKPNGSTLSVTVKVTADPYKYDGAGGAYV